MYIHVKRQRKLCDDGPNNLFCLQFAVPGSSQFGVGGCSQFELVVVRSWEATRTKAMVETMVRGLGKGLEARMRNNAKEWTEKQKLLLQV